jgi:hypothetical protein
MPNTFIHPNLMRELSKLASVSPFPNLITRQVNTRTYDPNTNEPIETPSNDPLIQNVASYIEPIDVQKEIRKADQTLVENGWYISIAGFYNITVGDTVIDENSNIYNVLHVSHDAFQTQTVLTCEIINTTVAT